MTSKAKGSDEGRQRGKRGSWGGIRKLPSGRYQARYVGPDLVRRTAPMTFSTKGDAQAWLATQSAAVTEHRWRPDPVEQTQETLATYAPQWLAMRDLKPRTRSEYRRNMKSFTEHPIGSVPLPSITRRSVREWYASLDPSKPTARAHRYALLSTILTTAVEDELITVNPARLRGAGRAKATVAIRPATVDELQRIADAMPARYRAMVHVAAWCALRFGELTELRREDVDLAQGVIRVRRAVGWVKDGSGIAVPVVGTPKSVAGIRDVTIPPHIIPILHEHLTLHTGAGRRALVFPNSQGEHMHHGSLYKVFKPARAAAGRPDLRWHDLRHTGATLAAQAGATTRELMDRLGHTTAGVAMRYQHVADGRSAEIAQRLSQLALGHEPSRGDRPQPVRDEPTES